MFKIDIDFDSASSALHLGVSTGLGHQIGSAEVQASCAAMMAIIHCPGSAGQDFHPENGGVVHRLNRRRLLLVRIRLLGKERSTQE